MPPLPSELLVDILSMAFIQNRNRTAILKTSRAFYNIAVDIMYTHLYFYSHMELAGFFIYYGRKPSMVPYPPRTVEFDLPNDGKKGIFSNIYSVLSLCTEIPGVKLDEEDRIVLDFLGFRMFSHALDSELQNIEYAIALTNPHSFTWTGPDPPHHFSTAIVPAAVEYLFNGLKSCQRLTHLKLTHISLRSVDDNSVVRLLNLPALETFYLGQAIFVRPDTMLVFVLGQRNLKQVKLVDAYQGSIWGTRLRRSDIESCAIGLTVPTADGSSNIPDNREHIIEEARKVIRQIVVCEAQTERIMGGDRAERNTILI